MPRWVVFSDGDGAAVSNYRENIPLQVICELKHLQSIHGIAICSPCMNFRLPRRACRVREHFELDTCRAFRNNCEHREPHIRHDQPSTTIACDAIVLQLSLKRHAMQAPKCSSFAPRTLCRHTCLVDGAPSAQAQAIARALGTTIGTHVLNTRLVLSTAQPTLI